MSQLTPNEVTLREYFESRLSSTREALELAREPMEDRVQNLERAVDSLKETRAEAKGKASQSSVIIAYAISLVGLALSLLAALRK